MDDMISRQAAIKKILGQPPEPHYPSWYAEQIKELPSAEPKRGRWINGKCSECSGHAPFWAMASTYHESNFCPNCGVNMRGEQE